MRRTVITMLLAVALAGCGNRSRIDPDLTINTGGDTSGPHPVYQLDTMKWVREGRAVVLDGQPYHPVGVPIQGPLVQEVGTFDGVELYIPTGDQPPYTRVLIPVKDGWQVFEPGDVSTLGDTTAAH